MTPRGRELGALTALVALALALRLYGVHNPILDHPGWRQGDEAAIARNFAQLENNILRPQTDYDGPPPNYVELELQIVPFAAAQFYRAFGVHETFGRLLVIGFSLGTVVVLYFLGKELFSARAGLLAALAYAMAPGAVYYGRTFTPDAVMVFFLSGTLLFWWRWCERRRLPDFWWSAAFGALAWLAKPPALLALAPILALALARRNIRALADWSPYAFLVLTLTPFVSYFAQLRPVAEWHWATGITQKHVLPLLVRELSSPVAFLAGLQSTLALLRMLATTILGPALFGSFVLAWFALPRDERRPVRAWFFGTWLGALCAYAFVVVNFERVDYYLLPFVPLAALVAAGAIDNLVVCVNAAGESGSQRGRWRYVCGGAVLTFIIAYSNMLEIHSYYTWSRPVYAAARELDRVLEPGALIVMGHYDPSVLYTIGRKGWEEDPLLWNVHDMTSAVHKGARYFVAVEVPRLRANRSLYRFLRRYRRVPVSSGWEVYDLKHFDRSTARHRRRSIRGWGASWAPPTVPALSVAGPRFPRARGMRSGARPPDAPRPRGRTTP